LVSHFAGLERFTDNLNLFAIILLMNRNSYLFNHSTQEKIYSIGAIALFSIKGGVRKNSRGNGGAGEKIF